ncbi:hypothetical protein EDB86DRAFT_2833829 [Lactarius hatsudake]|nr:hypothetical protein EDB86DRAFT_2833829 [Lactarius hatsudake]
MSMQAERILPTPGTNNGKQLNRVARASVLTRRSRLPGKLPGSMCTSDNNLGDTPKRRPHAPSTTTTTTGTATRDGPLPSSAPRPLDGDDGRDSNGTTHPRHPNNDGTATTTSPSARTPDDSDDMGLAEGTPRRHWSRALPTMATATTRAATEGIPLPAPAPHTLSDHGTTHLPCAPSTMTTTVTQFTHAGSAHPRSPTACNPYDDDDYEGDSDRRSDPMARVATSVCSVPSK